MSCPYGYQYQSSHRDNRQIIQGPNVKPSIRGCRNICDNELRCRGFGFNPSTDECVQLGAVLSDVNTLGEDYIFCARGKLFNYLDEKKSWCNFKTDAY